jgi:hypothetical protein
MYYFHQHPDTTLSAKNYFHPSLEAKDEGNTSNNKEKKIACSPAACNCLVISLSASIVTLLLCFGLLVTYIVTQPTFLQLDYPAQPQQQVQTSINNKSQQMQKEQFSPSGSPVGKNNNDAEQNLDDFSLAFADKTTTATPVLSPVVAPYKEVPQSSQGKNIYYDFIEAFQGSASSILATKPTSAPLAVDPSKTTAAPIKDSSGSKSTTNSSKVTTEVEFSSSLGKSNSTSVKNSSQEETKTAAPAKSKEKNNPTSAPATSLTSSTSGVIKTPSPTTNDGYYYYYYYTEKPVKNKGKSPNSTTSEKTKNSTAMKTADSRTSDVALEAVLSSLDSALTSTASSSSQSYSQVSNMGNSEATPTPSPYSTSTSSSSSSQSESQSSKIISYDDPTPSPSPFSSGASSGVQRDSQPSNLIAFSSDPNTLSTNGQQLPGTLLGAINDDDANVSVYGNAKSTIPCDLLMCDDAADDDYSDTKDSSNSESGGVTYDFSGNGILPGPYDTVTMTSASSTSPDGKMTSNPIEQIVGTPITQNSNNLDSNNADDGLCLDC